MKHTARNQTIYDSARVELKQEMPLQGPLLVHLETTNRCNFKCTFCPESLENYREQAGGLFQLSNEDYERVIDQLSEMPQTVKMLNLFTMGEPLMNKNIFGQVAYARKKLPQTLIVMSSNGALLTEKKYEAACKSGLDKLRISIFGHDDVTHRTNTQKNVPLDTIRENVKGFVEYRDQNGYHNPEVYVKTIESPNKTDNEAFFNYFQGVADKTVIEGLSNWNDDSAQFSQTLSVDMEALTSSEYYSQKKYVCPYPFYSFVVHSDLKVSVCCIDWNKKTVIGDLSKNSVEEVWNGKPLLEFQTLHLKREKHKISACKNCVYHHTLRDNIDDVSPEDFLKKRNTRPIVNVC